MNNIWDQRFAGKEYLYGKKPNNFFKAEIDKLKNKGKLLLPAEGEGRNAVYAASSGWLVTAFDNSIEGLNKAKALAIENNTSFEYIITDFEEFSQ